MIAFVVLSGRVDHFGRWSLHSDFFAGGLAGRLGGWSGSGWSSGGSHGRRQFVAQVPFESVAVQHNVETGWKFGVDESCQRHVKGPAVAKGRHAVNSYRRIFPIGRWSHARISLQTDVRLVELLVQDRYENDQGAAQRQTCPTAIYLVLSGYLKSSISVIWDN